MIYLTGFMGTGKTTIGKKLAEITGMPFCDMDDAICEKTGCAIPDIFKYASEASFRSIETDILFEISGKFNGIVATGGGAPVKPINRAVMKASGMVVNLSAPLEILKGRVGDAQSRPMWTKKVEALFDARKNAYADADLIIDTSEMSIDDAVKKIVEAAGMIPETVPVLLEREPYPVYLGRNNFENMGSLLKRHLKPEGIFVMVDENVHKLYREKIEKVIAGFEHIIMEVPAGEDSKSFAFLEQVLSKMLDSGMNRNWACVAIGGGVTGDLSGFASSVFMRGIPVVQVPTTLLAQVDASIGGKTGINHRLGKNLVGSFHQPSVVLCDSVFLDTLDNDNINGGMSEVVKYGIIMDETLFSYLEEGNPDMLEVVKMCCRDKAYVVARDEKEGSLRRILNFGHTLGHAIEQYYDFKMHHGEAVAMGMDFACFMSYELGLQNKDDYIRVKKLMNECRLVSGRYRLPPAKDVASAMAHDKKSVEGGIHYVLAKGIGSFEVRKLKLDFIIDAYKRYSLGH